MKKRCAYIVRRHRDPAGIAGHAATAGTQFTCLNGTKVQILTYCSYAALKAPSTSLKPLKPPLPPESATYRERYRESGWPRYRESACAGVTGPPPAARESATRFESWGYRERSLCSSRGMPRAEGSTPRQPQPPTPVPESTGVPEGGGLGEVYGQSSKPACRPRTPRYISILIY